MSHATCCIKSCKNTGKNSKCMFYRFPTSARKKDQRDKWINAVIRANNFVPDWQPKQYTSICSGHFVGDRKSANPLSPSYAPSVFSSTSSREKSLKMSALRRHERFMERRRQAKYPNQVITPPVTIFLHEDHNYVLRKCDPYDATKNLKIVPLVKNSKPLTERRYNNQESSCPVIMNVFTDAPEVTVPLKTEFHILEYKSQGCQAYVPIKPSPPWDTFTCCKYVYQNGKIDAEIQTELLEPNCSVQLKNNRHYKSKACGTPHKTYVDSAAGPNIEYTESVKTAHFDVASAIKNEEQVIELAGVTYDTFNFLLKRVEDSDNEKVTKKNKLLIFLIKLKSGMSSAAVGVFFGVHRSTIRRIFLSVLQNLTSKIHSEIIWPSKDVVIGTLPPRVLADVESTSTVEDNSNPQAEEPSFDDNCVYSYSQCKEEFTAKIFVLISKSGSVNFKSDSSKKENDSQTDSESDLESSMVNNATLSEKGFLELQLRVNKAGKKSIVVLPRFSKVDDVHTDKQIQEKNKSPRVKVHIRRIIQRFEIFKMLDKIPDSLRKNLDDIIKVCCILINLQPITLNERGPYSKNKSKEPQ